MEPKEKAQELFNKYYGIPLYIKTVKECCFITVDEILSMGIMSDSGDWKMAKLYWKEVKQEIEKL